MAATRVFLLIILTILLNESKSEIVQTFPTEEVYNYSSITDLDKHFEIIDKQLCGNQTNDKMKCCSCHPSCSKYNLCCIDYHWYDRQFGSLDEYYKYLIEKKENMKSTSCLPIIPKYNTDLVKYMDYIRMVDKCPINKDLKNTIYTNDNNEMKNGMPVYGNDNYIYKNSLIAKCHGIESYSPLNITASCNSNLKDVNIINNKCTYEIQGAKDQYLKCKPTHSIANSQLLNNKNNVLDSQLCNIYYGAVTKLDSGRRFRNIHCIKKYSTDVNNIELSTCSPLLVPYNLNQLKYSITLSFSKNLEVHFKENNKIIETIKCKENEIFDVRLMTCSLFQCGRGYIREGTHCVYSNTPPPSGNITDITEADSLQMRLKKCFLLKSTNGTTVYMTTLSNKRVKDLQNYLNLDELISYNSSFLLTYPNLQNLNEFKTFVELLHNFTISDSTNNFKLYLSSEEIYRTELYGLNLYKGFPVGKQCFKVDNVSIANLHVDQACNIKIADQVHNPEEYIITYEANNGIFHPSVYTCKQYHLKPNCPLYKVSKQNYTMNLNFSITINIEGVKDNFDINSYIPLTTGIGICVTETNSLPSTSSNWISKANLIEQYLTVLCAVLSVICYTFIISTYLYYKELRLVSGLNIVTLCVFLLLSDIIMLTAILIDNNSVTLCKYFAVLIHWSLLSVLLCTFIISFEIWHTFISANPSIKYSKSRFYWYLTSILLIPALIVSLCYYLDVQSIFYIGYGENNICYINSLNARIVFYIVPWCIVILLSTSTVVYVLQKIYRQQRISSQLLNKSQDQTDTSITKTALRLIVLLGVIELIGFVQLPHKSEIEIIINIIFQFAFTLLRGLRGLFIWLLYIYYNQRVRVHYSSCKEKKHEHDYSPNITRSSRISSKSQVMSMKTMIALKDVKS